MPRGRKRPAPFPAFSPFARSLIFSAAAAASSSSGPSKPLPLPDDATTTSAASGTPGEGTLLLVPKPLIPSPDYATQCIPCSPGNMPRPPSKRAKRAEPSSDEERISSESEEESFSASDSDGDDGEESSEEVTTYLVLTLVPGISFFPTGILLQRLLCSSADAASHLQLETVQADFAFFDPKPSDFHGVRLLLKTYLDSKPWDLTGFVDLILAQTTVGTVVKLADDDGEEGEGNGGDKTNAGGNDDDDLFGLISVLNLGRYAVCSLNI